MYCFFGMVFAWYAGLDVRGKGPPVVFSTGLYGSMTPFLYNDLINKIVSQNVSVITLKNSNIITTADVEKTADKIGVQRIGLLTHSSFDVSVLQSDRVERVAMMDPITLPRLRVNTRDGIFATSHVAQPQMQCLVMHADCAYEGDSPFVLPNFDLRCEGSNVQHIHYQSGHADVLDDLWADVGGLLGIETLQNKFSEPSVTYDSWRAKNKKRASRKEYRSEVSKALGRFFNTRSATNLDLTVFDNQ